MMIGSALLSNVRRIQRYLEAKLLAEYELNNTHKGQECSQDQQSVSFFASLKVAFLTVLSPFGLRKLILSC